jgi:peptidoglycan hydrolase-like protein with peptidoglycan-binding domain
MRYFLGLIVAFGMVAVAATGMAAAAATGADAPQPAKKKTVAAKQTAVRRPSTAVHSSATPVRRPNAATAANRKKGAPVKKAVTWRNRQLAPSPDRYREIQQALATKGYLQPEQATGTWDQNSTEALKRFQMEQNLEPSGKINSLSLIALGLGPKHDAMPTQIAAPEEPRR